MIKKEKGKENERMTEERKKKLKNGEKEQKKSPPKWS